MRSASDGKRAGARTASASAVKSAPRKPVVRKSLAATADTDSSELQETLRENSDLKRDRDDKDVEIVKLKRKAAAAESLVYKVNLLIDNFSSEENRLEAYEVQQWQSLRVFEEGAARALERDVEMGRLVEELEVDANARIKRDELRRSEVIEAESKAHACQQAAKHAEADAKSVLVSSKSSQEAVSKLEFELRAAQRDRRHAMEIVRLARSQLTEKKAVSEEMAEMAEYNAYLADSEITTANAALEEASLANALVWDEFSLEQGSCKAREHEVSTLEHELSQAVVNQQHAMEAVVRASHQQFELAESRAVARAPGLWKEEVEDCQSELRVRERVHRRDIVAQWWARLAVPAVLKDEERRHRARELACMWLRFAGSMKLTDAVKTCREDLRTITMVAERWRSASLPLSILSPALGRAGQHGPSSPIISGTSMFGSPSAVWPSSPLSEAKEAATRQSAMQPVDGSLEASIRAAHHGFKSGRHTCWWPHLAIMLMQRGASQIRDEHLRATVSYALVCREASWDPTAELKGAAGKELRYHAQAWRWVKLVVSMERLGSDRVRAHAVHAAAAVARHLRAQSARRLETSSRDMSPGVGGVSQRPCGSRAASEGGRVSTDERRGGDDETSAAQQRWCCLVRLAERAVSAATHSDVVRAATRRVRMYMERESARAQECEQLRELNARAALAESGQGRVMGDMVARLRAQCTQLEESVGAEHLCCQELRNERTRPRSEAQELRNSMPILVGNLDEEFSCAVGVVQLVEVDLQGMGTVELRQHCENWREKAIGARNEAAQTKAFADEEAQRARRLGRELAHEAEEAARATTELQCRFDDLSQQRALTEQREDEQSSAREMWERCEQLQMSAWAAESEAVKTIRAVEHEGHLEIQQLLDEVGELQIREGRAEAAERLTRQSAENRLTRWATECGIIQGLAEDATATSDVLRLHFESMGLHKINRRDFMHELMQHFRKCSVSEAEMAQLSVRLCDGNLVEVTGNPKIVASLNEQLPTKPINIMGSRATVACSDVALVKLKHRCEYWWEQAALAEDSERDLRRRMELACSDADLKRQRLEGAEHMATRALQEERDVAEALHERICRLMESAEDTEASNYRLEADFHILQAEESLASQRHMQDKKANTQRFETECHVIEAEEALAAHQHFEDREMAQRLASTNALLVSESQQAQAALRRAHTVQEDLSRRNRELFQECEQLAESLRASPAAVSDEVVGSDRSSSAGSTAALPERAKNPSSEWPANSAANSLDTAMLRGTQEPQVRQLQEPQRMADERVPQLSRAVSQRSNMVPAAADLSIAQGDGESVAGSSTGFRPTADLDRPTHSTSSSCVRDGVPRLCRPTLGRPESAVGEPLSGTPRAISAYQPPPRREGPTEASHEMSLPGLNLLLPPSPTRNPSPAPPLQSHRSADIQGTGCAPSGHVYWKLVGLSHDALQGCLMQCCSAMAAAAESIRWAEGDHCGSPLPCVLEEEFAVGAEAACQALRLTEEMGEIGQHETASSIAMVAQNREEISELRLEIWQLEELGAEDRQRNVAAAEAAWELSTMANEIASEQLEARHRGGDDVHTERALEQAFERYACLEERHQTATAECQELASSVARVEAERDLAFIGCLDQTPGRSEAAVEKSSDSNRAVSSDHGETMHEEDNVGLDTTVWDQCGPEVKAAIEENMRQAEEAHATASEHFETLVADVSPQKSSLEKRDNGGGAADSGGTELARALEQLAVAATKRKVRSVADVERLALQVAKHASDMTNHCREEIQEFCEKCSRLEWASTWHETETAHLRRRISQSSNEMTDLVATLSAEEVLHGLSAALSGTEEAALASQSIELASQEASLQATAAELRNATLSEFQFTLEHELELEQVKDAAKREVQEAYTNEESVINELRAHFELAADGRAPVATRALGTLPSELGHRNATSNGEAGVAHVQSLAEALVEREDELHACQELCARLEAECSAALAGAAAPDGSEHLKQELKSETEACALLRGALAMNSTADEALRIAVCSAAEASAAAARSGDESAAAQVRQQASERQARELAVELQERRDAVSKLEGALEEQRLELTAELTQQSVDSKVRLARAEAAARSTLSQREALEQESAQIAVKLSQTEAELHTALTKLELAQTRDQEIEPLAAELLAVQARGGEELEELRNVLRSQETATARRTLRLEEQLRAEEAAASSAHASAATSFQAMERARELHAAAERSASERQDQLRAEESAATKGLAAACELAHSREELFRDELREERKRYDALQRRMAEGSATASREAHEREDLLGIVQQRSAMAEHAAEELQEARSAHRFAMDQYHAAARGKEAPLLREVDVLRGQLHAAEADCCSSKEQHERAMTECVAELMASQTALREAEAELQLLRAQGLHEHGQNPTNLWQDLVDEGRLECRDLSAALKTEAAKYREAFSEVTEFEQQCSSQAMQTLRAHQAMSEEAQRRLSAARPTRQQGRAMKEQLTDRNRALAERSQALLREQARRMRLADADSRRTSVSSIRESGDLQALWEDGALRDRPAVPPSSGAKGD